jgi:hypothetical protein
MNLVPFGGTLFDRIDRINRINKNHVNHVDPVKKWKFLNY